MIRVLVSDDHQLLIDGIKAVFQDIDNINIVAEAHNGIEVLEILEKQRIDLVLMDINMPEMDGIECTKEVTKKFPDCKIIALSQFDEKRLIKRMVANGASGYLLKDTDKQELETAILKVYNGEKYFSDRISTKLLDHLTENHSNSLFPKLTKREFEILNLICQEYSSGEIAEKLFLSLRTVENHRAKLMSKSKSKNVAGLARWAVENHLVK